MPKKRKKTEQHPDLYDTFKETLQEAIAIIMRDSATEHVVFTPVLLGRPYPDGRKWFFIIATADTEGFHCAEFGAATIQSAESLRHAFMAGILKFSKTALVHDFQDELQAAQFCRLQWPSQETASICQSIEFERQHHSSSLH